MFKNLSLGPSSATRYLSIDAANIHLPTKCDLVIVGGGHNGLVTATYLARAGKNVVLLERRQLLGGAAVTETIIPGFKFSRASYLLSLFRPQIIQELGLKRFGLQWHMKEPSSFTPMIDDNRYLLMGSDMKQNQQSIAQFSRKDAMAYPRYEDVMARICDALQPLFDIAPIDLRHPSKFHLLRQAWQLIQMGRRLSVSDKLELYELLTAPISRVMNRWFESDVLKTTLGTDAVIGFASGLHQVGTGYVLLHHVMGGLDGHRGVWAFVIGGMGAVSNAIAAAAKEAGAQLYTNAEVTEILTNGNSAVGVRLTNGHEIESKAVVSNATPHVTFRKLLAANKLPDAFMASVSSIDYTSPVTKINVAVNKLPSFACLPNIGNKPLPHHQTTVHLNCENMQLVNQSYVDYLNGHYSKRPVIEMTIPTSVDRTLAPDGSHVVLLFTQYTPYKLADGEWDEAMRSKYANHVFSQIDEYCPGFSQSIVGYECLPPPVLEETFGLTGGNIFHGSMSLDQLYVNRPVAACSNYTTPLKNLYLCGSGSHPGGGVTGAPGRLAAMTVLRQH